MFRSTALVIAVFLTALPVGSEPEALSWEHAAFLEPLACVVHGQQAIGVAPGETVVILGAGPIGLLHLLVARRRGAARVIVVGRRPARLLPDPSAPNSSLGQRRACRCRAAHAEIGSHTAKNARLILL